MPTATTVHIVLNGVPRSASIADNTEPLLYVLRNRFDQQGPKFGCGISQCGSCTALVDGAPVRTCVTPCSAIPTGAEVTTLDGLSRRRRRHNEASEDRKGDDASGESRGKSHRLHPLQQAFIDEQAAQCAFCMNGIILGALWWLDRRLAGGIKALPSDAEVKAFLAGKSPESNQVYLCRCGAHARVVRAIQRAAKEMAR